MRPNIASVLEAVEHAAHSMASMTARIEELEQQLESSEAQNRQTEMHLADAEQRFPVQHEQPVAAVRLDVYPDGGLSRLRVLGEPTAEARSRLAERWLQLLPPDQSDRVDPGGFFA